MGGGGEYVRELWVGESRYCFRCVLLLNIVLSLHGLYLGQHTLLLSHVAYGHHLYLVSISISCPLSNLVFKASVGAGANTVCFVCLWCWL